MKYYYKTTDGKGHLCLKEPLKDLTGFKVCSKSEYENSFPKETVVSDERIAKNKELASLLSWFKHYDEQCMQYARHQRLGIESDIDIAALDAEAVTKAARIKELRK